MQRNRHSIEFRDQARSKAADRGKRTLEAVALELNVSLGTLKGWLKRPRVAGEPPRILRRLLRLRMEP